MSKTFIITTPLTKNLIPVMTHPLSKAWDQPDTNDILVDDNYALMDQHVFNSLSEYSATIPSGVYAGKMWKRDTGKTIGWWLCWYIDTPANDGTCTIMHRQIIIA